MSPIFPMVSYTLPKTKIAPERWWSSGGLGPSCDGANLLLVPGGGTVVL